MPCGSVHYHEHGSLIFGFMQNSLQNSGIFDHPQHLKAANTRNATLRLLAHKSCLNETRVVIFSSNKALHSGTLIRRLPHTVTVT